MKPKTCDKTARAPDQTVPAGSVKSTLTHNVRCQIMQPGMQAQITIGLSEISTATILYNNLNFLLFHIVGAIYVSIHINKLFQN